MTIDNSYGKLFGMPGKENGNGGNPAAHFGKQVRKERLAHGWSLDELSRRTGIAAGHLSRIENGRRPPTEKIANACDRAFPDRKGYFLELYEEMRTWAPPGFRDWPEYENKASQLSEWLPGVLTGMLQTEGYARALLKTYPGVTAEALAARLANRMGRQRRVLFRTDDPPSAWYIVDHTALYRAVGSPEVMAEQMRHLLDIADMPTVTVQVLPAIAHPATQSGFLIADDACYTEHLLGGLVHTDRETLTTLQRIFDTLRSECYRASESLAIIRKAEELWTAQSGVSPATAVPMAATA